MNLLFVLIFILLVIEIILYIGQDKSITGGRSDKVKNLKINPRSRSEAAVIKVLEDITGKKFPTVNPSWLIWRGRTLELDGYNDSIKVALEFSGPLHTKWSPQYESYKTYFERIVKDIVKIRLCKKNNVHLIVIDMSLPREHWRNYLLSRLYDIKMADEPIQYINKQTAEPFRNYQLERELNLECDIKIAENL